MGEPDAALSRSGQRAQALIAYRDAEAALRRELDVEPSHELQELAARIRADDPSLAIPALDVAHSPAGDEAAGAPTGEAPTGGPDGVAQLGWRRVVPILLLGVVAMGAIVVVGRTWMGGSTPAATEQPTSAEASERGAIAGAPPRGSRRGQQLGPLGRAGPCHQQHGSGLAPGRRRRGRGFPVGSEHGGRRGDPDRRRDLLVHRRNFCRRRPDVHHVGVRRPSGSPTAATARFRGSMPRRVTWYRSSRWAWAPSGFVADDRWVWVTNMLDGTLSRIDPVTEAVDTFPVGRARWGSRLRWATSLSPTTRRAMSCA